ncbi:MAG: VanZ family protein [Candidatus Hydrogenedentes bacterium]|nr:VanZ family protein [Candidatus Hydrogenedentota bacterium]
MRLPFYIAVALYCGAIFYMSHQSHPVPEEYQFDGLDKIVHVFLYGGLTALVSAGIRTAPRRASAMRQFWVPIVFAVSFGIVDEFHQYFIPLRNFDPLDVVANTTGALLAQVALCLGLWRISRRAIAGRP